MSRLRLSVTRSTIASVVATAVVGGLLVSAATASGTPADKAKFNDSSVWEVNRRTGIVRHRNISVDLAGSRVKATPRSAIEVSQNRSAVVLIDRSAQELRAINDRDIRLSNNRLKVSANVQVHVSRNFVFVSEPKLGIVRRFDSATFEELTTLDTAPPLIEEKSPVVVELGEDESLHVFVPKTGALHTWRADGEKVGQVELPPASELAQLTAIRSTPVVYDPKKELFFFAGRSVKTQKAPGNDLLLAMPTAFRRLGLVVVDAAGQVFSIDPERGDRKDLISAIGGKPIRPLIRNDGLLLVASSDEGTVFAKVPSTDPSRGAPRPGDGFKKGNPLLGRLIHGVPFIDDLESNSSATAFDDGKVGILNAEAPDTDSTSVSPEEGEGSSKGSKAENADSDATENLPPDAVDDLIRVRPDRSSVLAVLANDKDPNGDDLFVAGIEAIPPEAEVVRATGGQGLVFRPRTGFRGEVSFRIVVSDSDGQPDSNRVTVVVDDLQNSAPTAVGDQAEATRDRQSVIDVLANDVDPDGDAIALVEVKLESGDGEVAVTKDGALSVVPRSGGAVVASYVVNDERGLSSTATVTVRVSEESNLEPIARDDLFEVQLGRTVVLDLLANDVDPDGQNLTIVAVPPSIPPIGSLLRQGNVITFNPQSQGEQSFPYTITDGTSSASAQVKIVVKATVGNRPPLALPDRISVVPGVPTAIDLLQNDSDPDGDVLGLVSWTPPESVQLRTVGSKVAVEADTSLATPAIVRYEISDGSVSTEGTLIVSTVTKSGNLPPIAQDDSIGIRTGVGRNVRVLANDIDPEGGQLKVTAVDNPGVSVSKDGRFLTIAPDAFSAESTFRYTVSDSGGASSSGVVSVRVVSDPNENQPIEVRPDVATVRSGFVVSIPVTANDDDPEGDPLTIENRFEPGPSKGTVSIENGLLRYEANRASVGTDRFFYIVSDGHGGSASAEVRVGVLPAPKANRPPSANDDQVTVDVGKSVVVPVLSNDTDPDSDPLSITNVEPSDSGRSEIASGGIRYTARNTVGEFQIRYTIADTSGASDSARILVTVRKPKPLGLPPIAKPDASPSLKPGTSASVDVIANDEDPDGDPTKLKVIETTSGEISPDGKSITFNAGAVSSSIGYVIRDEQGNTAKGSLSVVVGDGSVLVARDDKDSVPSGGTVEIDVLANDATSETNAPLTLASVGESDGGSVVQTGSKIRFTAKKGFAGVATFLYTAADASGARESATVRITVAKGATVNRPPTLRAGAPIVLSPGDSKTLDLNALANDPEKSVLTFAVVSKPNNVTSAIADGVLSIAAPANAEVGDGSVVFSATDSGGGTAKNEVRVRVIPIPTTTTTQVPDVVPGITTTSQVTTTTEALKVVPGITTRQTTTVKPVVTTTEILNVVPGITTTLKPVVTTTEVLDVVPGNTTTIPTPLTPATITSTSTEVPTTQTTVTTVPPTVSPQVSTSTTIAAAIPGAPGAPQGSGATATSINWSWSAPTSDGGSPIVRYEASVAGPSAFQSVGSITSWSSGSLKPETTYTLQVRACNSVGCGPTSSGQSATIKPAAGVPGAPGAPTASGATSTSLNWSWGAPGNDGGSPITRYEVTGSGAGSFTSVGNSLNWSASGLTADTAYTLQVRACNDAGCGAAASGTGKTIAKPIAAPDAPGAPTATASSTSLNWTWAAPANDGGSPIVRYEYSIQGGPFASAGPTPLFGQSRATPDTTYTMQVRACNSVGCGPAASGTAKTLPLAAVVPGAPVSVSAGSPTTSSISWSWGAPASDGGSPITGYQVSTDGTSFSANAGTSFAQSGLTANTSYTLSVKACNSVGCGPAASGTGKTSAPAAVVPGAPVSVSPGTPTTSSISWSWGAPASDGGSPLTGYQVSTDGTSFSPSAGTSFTQSGLTANTTYTLSVKACNAVGCGPVASATGKTAAPAITVPGAPTAPVASGATATSINWSWSAPSSDGGSPITRYEASAVGGTWVPAGNLTFVWGPGLAANTSYQLIVRACNSVGCGAASSPGTGKTLDQRVPGAPSITGASGISTSAIRVTYSGPADPGTSPVTTYNLRINAGSIISTTGGSADWGGLAAGTTYTFDIQACNAVGCGAWSPGVQGSTVSNPSPVVTISKGARPPTTTGCTSTACAWIVVSVQNHTQSNAVAYANGVNIGAACTTSALLGGRCFYGFPGGSVYVIVDGVQSNTIVW